MPTKFGSSFVRMGSSPLYLVCVAALVAIAAGVPQCPPGSSPCTDDSIICTEVAFGGEDLGGLKCQSDSGVNPPCQCVIALCGVSTDCPGFSNGETCNPDQCLPADTGNGCCRICADCQTPTQACPDQCELNVSTFSFDCPTACPAAECRQNSDCSAAAMEPGTCVNDFCLAPRQVGESCDDNDDCEGAIDCESNLCAAPPTPCNNNTDCPVGTVCIEVGNVLPTDCTAPSNVGDPCDDTDDCVAGLTCDGNTCKASFGGACSSGSQCLSGTCANNLCDCGTDGNPACTTAGESCIGGECKPQSGVGDECDTNDTDDCDQNLTCDGNICKASFGEACSNNNQCLSGTCTNNLCDCGTDGNPACTTAGESCIGGECKPQSGAGEECDTDDNNDCESGECNGIVCACTSNDECTDPNQTCVGPSCVPFPGENGTCDDSDDCIQSTGFCDSGNDQCGVQTCTANTDCNTGFTCIELACAAPNADGGACNDNADCTSGLCTGTTCGCEQNADCTSNGETCVVVSCVGGPVVIGGACDDNDDCETMICENNVCATDGVPEAVGGDDRKGIPADFGTVGGSGLYSQDVFIVNQGVGLFEITAISISATTGNSIISKRAVPTNFYLTDIDSLPQILDGNGAETSFVINVNVGSSPGTFSASVSFTANGTVTSFPATVTVVLPDNAVIDSQDSIVSTPESIPEQVVSNVANSDPVDPFSYQARSDPTPLQRPNRPVRVLSDAGRATPFMWMVVSIALSAAAFGCL